MKAKQADEHLEKLVEIAMHGTAAQLIALPIADMHMVVSARMELLRLDVRLAVRREAGE